MRMLRSVIAFGIAWGMLSGVAFAEADWLDRWSGPGPFKGFFLHYRFLCLSNPTGSKVETTPLAPWDRTASALNVPFFVGQALTHTYESVAVKEATIANTGEYACKSDTGVRGYFELVLRHAVSIENVVGVQGSKVHMASYELAYVDRVSHRVDVSLGLGWNLIDDRTRGWWTGKLDSEDVGPHAFDSFSRWSFTPSIIYAPRATAGDTKRAHLVTIQAGATIFLKGFRGTDFCDPPRTACQNPAWTTDGADFVPMIRVLVNPSLLTGGW
jgi:hypothetical protein